MGKKKSPIAPGAGPHRLRPKLSHSGRRCGEGGSNFTAVTVISLFVLFLKLVFM